MRSYKISFVITEKLLTTVIQALMPEINDLNITQVESIPSPKEETPVLKIPKFSKQKTLRGSKTGEVILAVLQDGKPHNTMELGAALKQAGWNPNSVSPSVSKLVKDGKAKWVESGTYIKV